MAEGRDLPSLVTVYFGVAAVLAAALIFFLLASDIFSQIQTILTQQSSTYIIFNVSVGVSSIYLLFTLTALAVLASLYLLVVKPIGERIAKENREVEFFKYFSVFILLEFFISIISGLIPGYSIPSIYSMPLGVQAFVLGVSSLTELAVLQFVPLFIMILAYFALTGKLSLANLLHPYNTMRRDVIVPAIIASVITAALFSQTVSGAFFDLLTFFVLDYIYLRFGILHSFAAGFTVSMLGILTAFANSPVLALVTLVFLTMWSFLGIYNLTRLVPGTGTSVRESKLETQPESSKKHREPLIQNSEMLWIRSSCPNCGSANFYIRDGMRLECINCHHIIDKDAKGPANIIIEQRRPIRI
ncbi:MAG: hypothetical protein ACYCT2_05955 [Thermoplasmataceae archaeon]